MKELDVLEKTDLIALKMLINDNPMSDAEKRHYIEGANWKDKISDLKKINNNQEAVFDSNDLVVIEILTQGEKLNNAEKRHYIIGSGIENKIDELTKNLGLKSNHVKIDKPENKDKGIKETLPRSLKV